MQRPHKKKINRITPPILFRSIQQYLLEFEGDLFDKPRRCPKCNSSNIKKHSVENKLFCKLIIKNGFKDIYVFVRRFQCKDCGKTYLGKSPFYDGIMYSQPIVDLCLYYSAKNPPTRVERMLLENGIQVDRDTIRNYCLKFKAKIEKYAGMELFDKTIGVNLLKVMFDVENVKELRKRFPHKKYDGVADETYPTIKGAKKKFKEINKQRKLEGKEPFKYPKGFTLAVSYLALLELYACLVITEVPFSQVFSRILLLPMLGVDFLTTDGHGAYNIFNDLMEHLRCVFHKCKNLTKKDKVLKKMKKENKTPNEIKEYLKKKYKDLEKEELDKLKPKFPQYFDKNGKFLGALTSNAIEGGNWRLKNELRTAYSDTDSITARTILICLMDSIFTFRKGMPMESFAHKHTNFSFAKIMRY